MKKNILLLSIFVVFHVAADSDSFNHETLGLSTDDYERFVAVHGKRAVNEIKPLLPPKTETAEEKAARIINTHQALNNGYMTKFFVRKFRSQLTPETSRILAAMRLCEACENAGSVAITTSLGDSFPSVKQAVLEKQKAMSQKNIDEKLEAKRQLEAEIEKDIDSLNALKITYNELEAEQQHSSGKFDLVSFLEQYGLNVEQLPERHRDFVISLTHSSIHFSPNDTPITE